MGILDQASDPTTVGELWRLIKAAWADEPALKSIAALPDGSPIIATVIGTPVPHGSTKRIPRAAYAQAIGPLSDPVTVGPISRTHVVLYAAAVNTPCTLLVVL